MTHDTLLGERLSEAIGNLVRAARTRQVSDQLVAEYFAALGQRELSRIAECEIAMRTAMRCATPHSERPPTSRDPVGQSEVFCWLDLVHGNGYLRERAVRSIAGAAPNALLLILLIRRLNDWVPEVRRAAQIAVPRTTAASDPEVVGDALWVLLKQRASWGRIDETSSQTFDLVGGTPGVAKVLADRLMRATTGPAAKMLQQACRQPWYDEFLPMLAKSSVQPMLRAEAYRTLITGYARWKDGRAWQWTDKSFGEGHWLPRFDRRLITGDHQRVQLLGQAIDDPSAAVRRVAADALISYRDELGRDALELAKRLSADPRPSVAARLRFLLEQADREVEVEPDSSRNQRDVHGRR